jgi:uncharacterized protein (DUF1697 family)
MTGYVVMLRGVNVGGNTLKMDWLRKACEEIGLRDVRTYVQSGNLVLASSMSAPKLAQTLKTMIDTQARLPVTVIVRSANEISKVVAGNPFLKKKGVDLAKLHVTFLSKAPSKPALTGAALDKLNALAGNRDQYHLSGRELFLHCPINYGQTKLSNIAIEKIFAVGATTRNWKTVTALHAMTTQ